MPVRCLDSWTDEERFRGKADMNLPRGVEIRGAVSDEFAEILTSAALEFVASIVRHVGGRREELLRRRTERQREIDAGKNPDFLPETKHVRESVWTGPPIPRDLMDRRVEITGPTDRKMVINALNSGASVFMADFEDSLTPTWENLIQGQINLRDAARRSITFTNPGGK